MNRDVNKLKKIFKNCGINCSSDTKGKAIDELYALSESGQLGSGESATTKPVKIYKFSKSSIGVYFTFSPLNDLKVGDFCFDFEGSGVYITQIENVTEQGIWVDGYEFYFSTEYELKKGFLHRNDGYVE